MNSITFTILSCLPLVHCASPTYLAVFLIEEHQNLLKEKFFRPHDASSPFHDNNRHVYCEHSTIAFNPGSDALSKYELHFGHTQKLAILAYAEDEHGQTVLVHSITGDDNHLSMNAYPHVTISVSDKDPYTPVYSNDLWKRFVDNGIVDIEQDEFGKPRLIALKNQMKEWSGTLKSNGRYEETQAYIKIMDEVVELNGIFCPNNLWKNYKCQKY